ncbi:hypothetical protein QTH87_05465 [Variovorax sp. J22P168]|uniref:hypothetical protein n=1 Tax=Variovorax jilinensis TaxID=3053513 RepID=UPI0025771D46|nr:hypothetical protein [Variovorax sp. J22P168]MDM0011884.1 hypothetical protein [Variovorax sp. J22P168]
MNVGPAQWQLPMALLTIALLFGIAMWAWRRVAGRRDAERRIAAARVRSGHVPLEIPTVRGAVATGSGDSVPDTLPEWFIQGKGEHAVVDETPRIRLRYLDSHDRKHECVLQVEHLDVQKKTVLGHGDLPGDVRKIPLHRITSARIADSGQRFNVDTWLDAVRVARRRRGQL